MGLAWLGSDLLAELLEPLLGTAVDDDTLDRRDGFADAGDLGLGLPAAADHAERRRAGLREVRRRDAAAAPVRSCPILSASITAVSSRALGVEEHDDERRAAGEPHVRLEAGEPELRVDRGHDRERAVLEREPCPGAVVDGAARLPDEARLDGVERVARRQELADLRLRQVQRHVTAPS